MSDFRKLVAEYTISDSILPLLDVTFMLLGVFIILFAVTAAQSQSSGSASDSNAKAASTANDIRTMPSEVFLIVIQKDGKFRIKSDKITIKDKDELLDWLKKYKNKSDAQNKLALIQVESAWESKATESLNICKDALEKTDIHHTIIY